MENKRKILITGITGSLGRALCKYIVENEDFEIYGIYNSEQKFAFFKRNCLFKNIKCFKMNIADKYFRFEIDNLAKLYKFDYIIHSAAMKHVDICQDNPILAINTNIIASNVLIECAKLNNIKNIIALSTDKSLEPCNIYGYSKLIMQNIVLNNGFSVYQGANFFWSDGSVLDIWFNQMNNKQKLTVSNINHKRYFNTLNHVSKIIIKNLDINGETLLPDYVYLVNLNDMLQAFMEYFNYHNYEVIGVESYEKEIEELDDVITNRIEIDVSKIKDLIKEYFD
jgi:FlaA1/EpsC-like NDP-sugar epimerase